MLRSSAAVHPPGAQNGVSQLRSIGGSVVVRPNHLRLLAGDPRAGDPTLVESYRRLADVFHEVLAEQSLDALLVRIADTVGDLIPLDTLSVYEADETKHVLKPVLVRDVYADEIMSTTISFAEGITGWAARHREAVLSNQAHLDPRVRNVPGTPLEPEALICIPLIARDRIKGALNIYREGDAVAFNEVKFEIAKRFAHAAALPLDNAETPATPEHAMNPRELAACAEAAMMTAKAQGKNQVVLYAEDETKRPDAPGIERDVRSIAHLKMLQSLTGKLNRLNDVREIGDAIAAELRSLVDYHNCRVFVSDGDELVPVSFLGELTSTVESLSLDLLRTRIGVGITGRCAELAESIVVGDAANCEFGRRIEGTDPIEESLL